MSAVPWLHVLKRARWEKLGGDLLKLRPTSRDVALGAPPVLAAIDIRGGGYVYTLCDGRVGSAWPLSVTQRHIRRLLRAAAADAEAPL